MEKRRVGVGSSGSEVLSDTTPFGKGGYMFGKRSPSSLSSCLFLLQLALFAFVDERGELVLVENEGCIASLFSDREVGTGGMGMGGGDFRLFARLAVLFPLLTTHLEQLHR